MNELEFEELPCYCVYCCPNGHCACADCEEPCDCDETEGE